MSQELGRAIPYDFNVTASSNNGFIVTIGCCIVCFESKSALIDGITKYLDNPRRWQTEYSRLNRNDQPIRETTPGGLLRNGLVDYADQAAQRVYGQPERDTCAEGTTAPGR